MHVAFVAPSRAAVDVFYAAAMKAGGKDNGPPGLRPNTDANYYGAFVLDPDGNNAEAVCHLPDSPRQKATSYLPLVGRCGGAPSATLGWGHPTRLAFADAHSRHPPHQGEG